MKAVVDAGACVGCGLCVDTCPEVYELKDGVAVVKVAVVAAGAEAACKEAATSCPVECIALS